MDKLIIENQTSLHILDALDMIKDVINQGRISNNNKQYCYGTLISGEDKNYMIYSQLNKKSDKLIVIETTQIMQIFIITIILFIWGAIAVTIIIKDNDFDI